MPASLAAAIEFAGPTLRYAAVVGGLVPRLRALGEVAFDADAWALLGDAAGAEALAAAVGDALGGIGADHLTAVLHAPDAVTWTAAFPADLPAAAREARLVREADLLLVAEDSYAHGAPLHIATAPLGTDGARAWVQAVVLPGDHAGGLARIAAALGLSGIDVRVAPHAAAGAVPGLVTPTLAVGLYGGSGDGRSGAAEFALAVGGGVRLVGYAPTAEPVDAAFAALRLVASVGGGAGVGALALYGDAASGRAVAEAFEAAFGVPARALDALGGVGMPRSGTRSTALDAAAPLLAPVVGAALAALDA